MVKLSNLLGVLTEIGHKEEELDLLRPSTLLCFIQVDNKLDTFNFNH